MVRIPKYVTFCTVCHKMIGVRPSWVRSQAGQSDEWRVARHGQPRICTGTGIVVPDDVVFPNTAAAG